VRQAVLRLRKVHEKLTSHDEEDAMLLSVVHVLTWSKLSQ